MFRTMAVALSIALLAFVGGCSSSPSSSSAAGGAGGAGASTATARAAASPSASATCPAKSTKKAAKTLFVVDVGVSVGAFKKWIYNPWKAGSFNKGTKGRIKAIIKAAVAGAFVINRLNAAKVNAQSDPLLCKLMIAPIKKVTSSLQGLVGKAKTGRLNPADVAGASGDLGQLQSASSGAGAPVKEQNASIPGLG
jgi:hypothetical protein